ncbi:MAG: membrane protein insertion efficiency factor YidD [Alphaproteobacteria bacterium]|nr:membrane protein insertion efficiency factor YidD [Alphaproteobacteria bacterium]
MPDFRPSFRQAAVGLLSAPIHIYRSLLSPLLPPSCRYNPTCSAYALEALKIYGPVRGLWLAVCRIMRCHPISWLGGGEGVDPVPLPHPKQGHS